MNQRRYNTDNFNLGEMVFNNGFAGNSIFKASYPPYNVIDKEDGFLIEIAVAGFDRENIKIEVKDSILIISGKIEKDSNIKYIHKGVSEKPFSHSYRLDNKLKIEKAELKNGMLRVSLLEIEPKKEEIEIIEID